MSGEQCQRNVRDGVAAAQRWRTAMRYPMQAQFDGLRPDIASRVQQREES
jgi:hypothetical protein